MKNILKVFIITAGFVLCFNAKSFAVLDIAAYGGFIFNGDVEGHDFKGGQYGFKGHYNTSFIPQLIDIGVGAYWQHSKVKVDKASNFTRKTSGLDMNFILATPIIHPYARFTWAFMDRIESARKSFKTFGAGVGVEFTFAPFIRLFGEYMYDTANHKYGDISSNAVNFGVKVGL